MISIRYKLIRYKLIRYKGIQYKKGASPFAVLLTLALFSSVVLGISAWTAAQQREGVLIYQRYQAVLLAQNQFARQRLGLDCQNSIEQNQLLFRVSCQSKQVKVRFPAGELTLNIETE
ncbi:DUF5374 domain-containing protein [Testudinibacter sp. TR-2022]|uniref:DUF5374 domain-containing protein n=1 Tax=Testudinibacter sp. TR-2022 TaxID=2585029 RepID=UPI001118EB90|nr:DUF5374 domain-containing protein [Testudinibacter sp. TR-2022]TNH09115.1 hypothetical protein FHQ30_01290 [Pasteurellaceae bacterium Phil11]TNH21186.1 hypothetical protein FHQ29_10490 [Testudinibacter sp. TR-2022]TNH26418.1 hypothetical protein FHQ27_07750 [Testudinibacter sp. TR-2022]